MVTHPYLAPPRPRAFAHRGWHTGELAGLENTLAAFRAAVAAGYAYVETDVHATADGVLVVHHDAALRRVTGHPGTVRAMTWSELAEVRVGGREALPRLEEVLEAFPDTRFNVDLKSPEALAPMTRLLERDEVAARVAVASTDERRLAAVRRRFGDRVVTGLAVRSVAALRVRSLLPPPLPGLVPVHGSLAQVPVAVGPWPVVDRWSVAAAHAAGLEVHAWTVDRPAEMRRLLDLGVDGLMTDRPDLLRTELRRRGAWTSGHPTADPGDLPVNGV